MSNQSMYAMYVIGQVESNHNWASINRNDPITLGMMQWYGNRAKKLILLGKSSDADGYNKYFASTDAAAKANADADMSYYYTNDADAAAWVAWAATDNNHKFQQAQWDSDYTAYAAECDRRGFPANNMKERVFFMTMWHQSPVSALRVIDNTSATANLQLIWSTCLNDRVLSAYPNRYNTAYNMLKNWDGTSAPPDFGQIDNNTGNRGQASTGTITPQKSSTSWIQLQGSNLILHNGSKKQLYKKSTAQNWILSSEQGKPISGGQTDSGSSSGNASDDQKKVYELELTWQGKFAYSQAGGRLDPLARGYTDCSGVIWRAYQNALGIDVGKWTGAMAGKGKLIASSSTDTIAQALSKAQESDIVLINWPNGAHSANFDHSELYSGNGTDILSHGGPGKGPVVKNVTQQLSYAESWQFRRYIS